MTPPMAYGGARRNVCGLGRDNIVNGRVRMNMRRLESRAGVGQPHYPRGFSLTEHVHLPDAQAAQDAADLMERFGGFAADEAAARASRSRDLGNVIHYCRWRQIQRLIEHLDGPVEHTFH